MPATMTRSKRAVDYGDCLCGRRLTRETTLIARCLACRPDPRPTQQELDQWQQRDAGWGAALLILRGALADDDRVWRNVGTRGINFKRMVGTMSSGERALVEIAGGLYNGDMRPNLYWAFSILSHHWAELAIAGIRRRMQG